MCGRFYLDAQAEELKATFSLSSLPALEPRYNIAPSQSILAVVTDESERVGRWFRWGLIPAWAKDAKLGYRTINARVETVAEKPAYRTAFRHRRALIPASGYFEWLAEASGKQPYCIRPSDDQLLAFAGLYEHWEGSEGESIDSCTIIVTDAAPSVTEIHDRMPLCLAPAQYDAWLDPQLQDPEHLQALIDSGTPPDLQAYPVTRSMNNHLYDRPDNIEPLK
ncbi:MAG: SOS response-associated peptidase [Candidatus Thiodiazotropha endolucinida]